MNLVGFEAKAITAWDGLGEECDVLHFRHIASSADIPLHNVRRAVRSLARRGLAEFVRFSWTEEGEPYGAGYRLTTAGRTALREGETT